MGMSIDEIIKEIKNIKRFNYTLAPDEVFTSTVSILRKYQKIEELYDYWRSGKCEYTISCMENIGKVLRDGKIY